MTKLTTILLLLTMVAFMNPPNNSGIKFDECSAHVQGNYFSTINIKLSNYDLFDLACNIDGDSLKITGTYHPNDRNITYYYRSAIKLSKQQ